MGGEQNWGVHDVKTQKSQNRRYKKSFKKELGSFFSCLYFCLSFHLIETFRFSDFVF